MNYNDYDSNGNKKDFSFSDMMSDKKQRSRLILAIYAVIIIILVVMVRVGGTNTSNKNKIDKKNKIVVDDDKKEKDEIDEKFSLIDDNNYEFKYTLNYDNDIYIADGKRFDNKFSFTFVKEGETPIEFLGTRNYIKAMVDGEEKDAGLPYMHLNYYDNDLLKKIIKKSVKLDEENYTITNIAISDISSEFKTLRSDNTNNIKLIVKNNKITGMIIDYSNATSELLGKEIKSEVTIEYQNFNLIDDFSVFFE